MCRICRVSLFKRWATLSPASMLAFVGNISKDNGTTLMMKTRTTMMSKKLKSQKRYQPEKENFFGEFGPLF